MNAKRPDLAKLSSAEKDALIRDLWRQVAAGQSEARVLRRRLGIAEQASEKGESALLEKLREAAPRRPVELTGPPAGLAVKLGRGLKLWQSPVVMGTVALLCAAFAIDGGIGIWQQRALQQQRQARLLLEHEARTSLYVELKRIVPGGRRQVLPHDHGDAEHRPGAAALRHAERGRRSMCRPA